MTHKIEKISKHGDLIVYRRCWDEPGLRRYAVHRDSDGRVLEEFRRKQSAEKWARSNS